MKLETQEGNRVGVLKVCYKSGVRFDEQYYLSKHIPLAAAYFMPFGVKQVEVLRFSDVNGQAPVYQVMITVHFESMAGLQQALSSPGIAEVIADVANYYDGAPDLLVGAPLALPTSA